MIIQDRDIPRVILKLQALLRRLPLNHPKIQVIVDELNRRSAGHKGEEALDYPLSLLDPKKYLIFHGLRLQINNNFFQIDTLVISKHFILLTEVKNLAGSIYFDPVFSQLIQMKDDQKIAFPDPQIQLQRQEMQFKNWLLQNGFSAIPISSLVVISNDKTIIKTSPDNNNLNSKVIHRHLLPMQIHKFEKSHQYENINDKEIKKLVRLLKKKHVVADHSILERFNLSPSEVREGVICDTCNHSPLVRKHGAWFCIKCKSKNTDGHIQALIDYQLLIKPTISNGEARKFLNIESRFVAIRLLKSLNLPADGYNKGTTYDLTKLTKQNPHPNPIQKPATTK
ncbi:nuclease-related domain-containing protein [Rossellomorea oryzaecorticis]|uniref:Nuclease-related domain-containing protein n=1 Tax=Rossellomorea oryzaecorticis TaxID=1396505 RepID=A0ABU9K918_9BACI